MLDIRSPSTSGLFLTFCVVWRCVVGWAGFGVDAEVEIEMWKFDCVFTLLKRNGGLGETRTFTIWGNVQRYECADIQKDCKGGGWECRLGDK